MATQPNIVLIVMEDTRPRFGCYGDDTARTPNLDRIAAEGCRYPNMFSTAPVCAPSRSSAMTGCYQTRIGTHQMRTRTHDVEGLPESYQAVPPHYVTGFTEYLRGAGYFCALDSKTDYQFGEPFTMWDHHNGPESLREDGGRRYWRETDDPFFVMYTNGVTHESGMWPPEEPNRFGGDGTDLQTDPAAVEVPPYLVDTEGTRRAIAQQYDNIAKSDAAIGQLLDKLEEDGILDETLILVTSDHGEGLPRCKRWPYDGGINVPLLARWPGQIEAGTVDERMVSLVDLAPTMCSIADISMPTHFDGQAFIGPEEEEREYIFAARDRHDEDYDMVRVARDQQYKYIRNYYPGDRYDAWVPYRNKHPATQALLEKRAAGELNPQQAKWFDSHRPAEELYDIQADPYEMNNLAGDPSHRDVLDRFRRALDDWMDRTNDRGLHEEEYQMRDRFWPEGDQPQTGPVHIVPNAPNNRASEPIDGDRATLEGPAEIRLHCATQGASIGYTLDDEHDEPDWELYVDPIQVPPGETTIRAKAIRYGFEESDERTVTVTIEA